MRRNRDQKTARLFTVAIGIAVLLVGCEGAKSGTDKLSDAGILDTGEQPSDAGLPDAAQPAGDAQPGDAQTEPGDTGPADSEPPVDSGPVDAGGVDAGAPADAMPADAMPADATPADAAPADAAPADAAPVDAGPPVYNYAFISPVPSDGDLGGLTGADALCDGWASTAGIAGTYRAILSTDTIDARDRLTGARGWIRPDGRPVGDTPAQIFTLAGPLAPVRLGPDGTDIGFIGVWSASGGTGTYKTNAGSTDCGDWGSADPGTLAWQGFSTTVTEWLDRGTRRACDTSQHLYCFQIDYVTPLTVADFAEPGRRMFVSTGNFDVSSGIAGADGLCTGDAANDPNLSGSSFSAYLADFDANGGSSAHSRFAAGAEPIVRLDGLRVANGFAELGSQDLIHPPYLRVGGGYYDWRTFTGASSPTAPGSASTTCNGWSDATMGNGQIGFAGATSVSSADRIWFGSGNDGCASRTDSLPVYCLED